MKDRAMRYEFFLGGNDLEMETIRRLLAGRPGVVVHDRQLTWGASASDYASTIEHALAAGHVPVLVELPDDVGAGPRGARVVDHHGAASDRPSALRQVFDLLGLPDTNWTRWFDLVAANDQAYLPGLQARGASVDEMRDIRAADRRAQGVSTQDEADGEAAVRAAVCPAPGITVVRLPHGRTAVVTDRLHRVLGGQGYQILVVFSPSEVNVFAPARIVRHLVDRYPGTPAEAWSGGSPEGEGFWGRRNVPDNFLDQLLALAGETPGSRPALAAGR